VKEEKSDTRAEVLREAARLFTSQGFHGTSMDDIASALRITKPAVYYYFKSKSDILYEIYGRVSRTIIARIEAHDDEWDPEYRLRQTMHDVMEVIRQMPVEVTVFSQEGPLLSSCLPRRQANELRALEKQFTDYVTDTVEDAMNVGVMRRMDPTLTAYAFISMVSWASRWYLPTGRVTASEIAELFFDIGMNGARKTE
jgi:AcrR family transcriptional regulator